VERKGIIRSKEKRKIKGKGRELGLMEYCVPHCGSAYWQPYRLAPLKMSSPPLAFPLKKAGAATAINFINDVIGL